MKSFNKFIGVLVIACLVVLMNPTLRYSAMGLVRREKFVSYHPISYWIAQCHSTQSADRYDAVIALSQAGVNNSEVSNALTERCSDFDTMVKIAAIHAVSQLGCKSVTIHSVLQQTRNDANFLVRNAAQTALQNLYNEHVPTLSETLESSLSLQSVLSQPIIIAAPNTQPH